MSAEKPKRVGTRAKLRSHFLANIGRIMSSDELREVAGKSEWARRVRELRNEEGYQILTHNDRNDLKPGEYLLENAKPHPYDSTRKIRLHIGHIVDKSQGGQDEPTNLRALCSVCNEGASNLTLDRPTTSKLLIQLRRAKREDQLTALAWLKAKYPDS